MGLIDRAIASSVPAMPRPLVRKIAGRYMAGATLEEAVRTVRELNAEGCVATVDVLGEFTRDASDAREKLEEYKRVVDALVANDLASGISVKLTALGLDIDERMCRENLEEIVAYAGERDRFVRVDMEDSPHTAQTLELVMDAHERHQNTGAVIQAYLRRSLKDVERLAGRGISVRLCKGIYDEPRRLAYKNFDVVRANYVLLLETLMRAGCYVGVATHDEYLVWHATRLVHQLGLGKDRYEFQMLLGVDEPLRRILVGAGHKVRVYVPFGKDWYEYSTRRLKENPRIATYIARDMLEIVTDTIRR
ncbi:MAG: proline dehydrogenase family protein [Actinomycetota bacterium]